MNVVNLESERVSALCAWIKVFFLINIPTCTKLYAHRTIVQLAKVASLRDTKYQAHLELEETYVATL